MPVGPSLAEALASASCPAQPSLNAAGWPWCCKAWLASRNAAAGLVRSSSRMSGSTMNNTSTTGRCWQSPPARGWPSQLVQSQCWASCSSTVHSVAKWSARTVAVRSPLF